VKIGDEAKPEDMQETNEGNYSQEQLEEMLEGYVRAKQIEADPQKLAMLKDYAMSKSKAVADLFDVNKTPPPKSLKDLKKAYDVKVMEDDED
jgi:hypothetical protein